MPRNDSSSIFWAHFGSPEVSLFGFCSGDLELQGRWIHWLSSLSTNLWLPDSRSTAFPHFQWDLTTAPAKKASAKVCDRGPPGQVHMQVPSPKCLVPTSGCEGSGCATVHWKTAPKNLERISNCIHNKQIKEHPAQNKSGSSVPGSLEMPCLRNPTLETSWPMATRWPSVTWTMNSFQQKGCYTTGSETRKHQPKEEESHFRRTCLESPSFVQSPFQSLYTVYQSAREAIAEKKGGQWLQPKWRV